MKSHILAGLVGALLISPVFCLSDWDAEGKWNCRVIESPMSYSFCSTQINLPILMEADLRRLTFFHIPELSLARKGREHTPHITIRYGLLNVNPEAVREAVKDFPEFSVRIGRLNMFPSRGDGDVLYVEVSDSDGAGGLRGLRSRLDKFVDPEREEFSNYSAHITLAYIKPGELNHLIGTPCTLTGEEVKVSAIMYCEKGGVAHECQLKTMGERLVKPVDIYNFYGQII